MSDTADTANVIIRPPIAWALAVLAGLALQWLVSLPFMPASVPAGWVGGMVLVLALALFAWAIATVTSAGSNVPTSLPTTTIVETGPYRFTRNPIYLGMILGLVGLAIAFDSLWLLVMLVPFTLLIRYGVVAREEAYLERKFDDPYRQYRARVRALAVALAARASPVVEFFSVAPAVATHLASYDVPSPSPIRLFFDKPCETIE
ncbi:MAG: isoprenylcysteine carboxylmethyltransferase family protein [Rhizobiales bacterium]|nr:isoprenylcysteine carboxylmethyltransferase family protein [Hyphomicrobiales bacterium]